jgi:hypothetical protein
VAAAGGGFVFALPYRALTQQPAIAGCTHPTLLGTLAKRGAALSAGILTIVWHTKPTILGILAGCSSMSCWCMFEPDAPHSKTVNPTIPGILSEGRRGRWSARARWRASLRAAMVSRTESPCGRSARARQRACPQRLPTAQRAGVAPISRAAAVGRVRSPTTAVVGR